MVVCMHEYVRQLKHVCEEKNIQREVVARKIGVSEQYLAMVELGEIIPTTEQLERIMEFVISEIN